MQENRRKISGFVKESFTLQNFPDSKVFGYKVPTSHNEAFFILSDGNALPLSTCLKNQTKERKALGKLVLGENGNTPLVSSRPFVETFINNTS